MNKIRNPDYRVGGQPLPPKVDEGWKYARFRLISTEVEDKKINLEDTFGRLDVQRTGTLTMADFHRGMAVFSRLCTPEEISVLADEYDVRHDGHISYQLFINRVQDCVRRKDIKERVINELTKFCTDMNVNFEMELRQVDPRDTRKLSRDDVLMLFDRLQYKGARTDLVTMLMELPMDPQGLIDLRELTTRLPKPRQKMTPQQVFEKIKQYLMQHSTTLERVFPEFDSDGDGQLSPIEFQGALNKMSITGLTTSEITSLIQYLDSSVDGKISLQELGAKMGLKVAPQTGSTESKVIDQTMQRLKDLLGNRGKQLLDFFREADVTQANALTKDQLQHALLNIGITLSQVDMERLLTDLDRNRDNRISYLELKNRFDQAEETAKKFGSEAITRIKQAVRGRRLTDVFQVTYDSVSRQKCIPVGDFRRSVEYLNLGLSIGDMEKVTNQLDRNRTGLIPLTALQVFYDENVDTLAQQETMSRGGPTASTTTLSKPQLPVEPNRQALTTHWAEKHFQEIREYCARQKRALLECLKLYTDGVTDKIMPQQLQSFLAIATTTMASQSIDRLVRELLRGTFIPTRDFTNLVEGLSSSRPDTILDQVRDKMDQNRQSVDQVFRADPDGWIYRADLTDGLMRMGVTVPAEDLLEVINLLNPDIRRLNITNPAAQKIHRGVLMDRLKLTPSRPGPEVEAKVLELRLKAGIYDLMVDHIRTKNVNLERDCFLQYDRSGTNVCGLEDFIQVLKRLTDSTVPRDQLEMILKDFEPKGGQVRYPAFIKKMEEGSIQKAFLDRILTRLRSDMALRPQSIEDMCREFDRDRSGFLTFGELGQALSRGGVYMDSQELRTLCESLEHNPEGKVSYTDLHRRVTRQPAPRPAAPVPSLPVPSGPTLTKSPTYEWSQNQVRQVRQYLNSRQLSAKDFFRELDKDRNNTLSAFEFQQGLMKLGAQLTEGDLQRLMTELDLNKDGRISLIEFERIVGVLPKDQWAERLTQDLRAAIRKANISLRAMYTDADTNRDQLLSHEELVSAIQRLNPSIPIQELRRLAEYLDIDHEGQISYPIFSKALDPESVFDLNFRIKSELERQRVDLMSVFRQMDTNRDNCLQPDAIKREIERLRLGLSEVEMQAILWENVLYRTKDGRLSYTDLLEQLGLTPRFGDSRPTDAQGRPYGQSAAPVDPYSRPADPYSKPADPYSKPADPYNRPADPYSKPADPYSKPADPYSRPADPYSKPADPYSKPADPYSRPGDPYRQPEPARNLDPYRPAGQSSESLRSPPPPTPSFGTTSGPPGSFSQTAGPLRQPQYPGTWSESYYQAIKDYMARTYTSLKDLFAEFDLDRNNALTPFEFSSLLQKIGVRISETDLKRLCDELDVNKDGKVSLIEFERILGVPNTDIYAERLLDQVIRSMKMSGLRPRDVFERYDMRRDGQLSYTEFERALRDLQVTLNYTEIQAVLKYLDLDKDGRISYGEFALRAEGDTTKAINVRVMEHLKSTGLDLMAVLKQFDTLGDGYMRLVDLKAALDRLKFPLTLDETNTLAQQTGIRRHPDGRISYPDLLDRLGLSSVSVSSSSSSDQAIAKVRQHWSTHSIIGDKLFLKYDIQNDQHVTPQSFFEALTYLNCPITRSDVDLITTELLKLPDGRINYSHFLAKVTRQGLSQYSQQSYTRIRSQLELRNVNLAETFRMFDTAGDGKITREGLKAAFNRLQISTSDLDFACIMDDLDPAMNGRIPYADLVTKVRGQTSFSSSQNAIKHPYLAELEKIKGYLRTNRKTVKEFFTEVDKDQNNAVTPLEFTMALRQLGINIPEEDLRKITEELDPRREGRINLPAFERLFAEEVADEKFLLRQFSQIRSALSQSRLDPRTVFTLDDPNGTGSVQKSQFIQGLERLCSNMTRGDASHMADLLDYRQVGLVNYEELLKKLMEEPIESLNEKVRSYIHTSGVSLATAFTQYDPGDQCIPASQMRSVLESLRLPLRPEEITRLIHDNSLFRTSDQRLSYRDLMERIGLREKPIQPKPKAVDVFARIREAWRAAGTNPQDVFRAFDYEGDQHLTLDNLGRALSRANSPCTHEELEVLSSDVNRLPDGRISSSHFIQKVLGQAAASPTNSVYAKIKVFLQEKRIDLQRVLQQADRDMDRFVTYEEFANALQSVNLMLSDPEFYTIFQDLDKMNTRKIPISEVISRIGAATPPISRQDLSLFLPQLNLIKTKLAEYRVQFDDHFRRPYRVESDGCVNVTDFKDALSRLGMSNFAPETQNFANVFLVRGTQKVQLTELEFAIRDLGTMQVTANRPRYRVLTREDMEYVYQCLDYISECIKESRESPLQVVRRYDINHNGTIEFSELRKMVNEELKIPSEEGVLGDIFLLLEDERGVIPEQKLVDALTGVRVKQKAQGNVQSTTTPGYAATTTPGGPTPDPVSDLRDFMRQKNLQLVNIFGRNSGTIASDTFKQALSNIGYRPSPQQMDLLISRIATNIGQQTVALDALDRLLSTVPTQQQRPGSDLITRLRSYLQGRNVTLMQLVGRTSGQIDTEMVLRGLNNAGFSMTRDEQFAFTTQFGTDVTGRTLSLDKLNTELVAPQAAYFTPDAAPQGTMSSYAAPQNRTSAYSSPDPRASVQRAFPSMSPNLQDAILALNTRLDQLRYTPEDAFSYFDADKDGVLSKDEFLRACHEIQAGLQPDICAQLFTYLDTNQSNTLSVNEFARKLTGARAPERRLNANIAEDLEREIRQLFEYFDTDKSGVLDENEIRQALRAYNFAGTEKDIRDMVVKMDRNRDGKIQYSEFKAVMEEKILAENRTQEEEMRVIRQKFMEADYDKVGYLTPQQLTGALQKMGMSVPEGDLKAVIDLADSNKDGKIDIDEFMMLITTDDPSILSNPQVMAARFSINRARKLSPIDFLNMFQGVPRHFMQSFVTEEQKMGRLLQANEVTPTLDRSGLILKDVNVYPVTDRFNKQSYLRMSSPACGGQITIRLAKGIPIPDPTQVNYGSIIKRLVKVCLYDEKRSCFVGSSCFLVANWRQQEQDIWNFEQSEDRDIVEFRTGPENIEIQSLSLIFEFTIFIVRQQPIEMSCGFARLPLANFERSTNIDLPVSGGSPGNPMEINMSDVRVKRTGLKNFLLKTGSMIIKPTVTLVLKSHRRLTAVESSEIEALPSYCVVRKRGATMVKMYREEVARITSEGSREAFTVPTSSSALLAYFPSVMNCPDTWVPLINHWTSFESGRVTIPNLNPNDPTQVLRYFTLLVNRLYGLLKSEEFAADESALYKLSYGAAGDLSNKRFQWATRALTGASGAQGDQLKFRPFSAQELMPKSLLHLDQVMARQLLTINKARAGAQSPAVPANATAVPRSYANPAR